MVILSIDVTMNKHRLFRVVSIIFLLTQTFPPINILIPISESLKLALFMGVTLILFPNVLLRGSMIALLVYTLETFVYFISGNVFYDSISNVITSYLMMGSALVLTDYVFTYD